MIRFPCCLRRAAGLGLAVAVLTGVAFAQPVPQHSPLGGQGSLSGRAQIKGQVIGIRTGEDSPRGLPGISVELRQPDGKPLPEKLRVVLRRAAWEFDGVVEVMSGYRSLAYNRGIYGHRCKAGKCRGDRSQHIVCKAADIRIAGVSAATMYSWALRQPELGGVGRYPGDFIHVDIRPRPRGKLVTWDWRGRKYARKHSAKRRYAKLGS